MKDKFYSDYMRLGLSVAFFRKYKGMTQEMLAEKMNVSIETIRRIENAYAGASMDMMLELSKALNISLSELFAHAKL